MKSKRLITTGLAMLTVMSVFATNNAGAQDAVELSPSLRSSYLQYFILSGTSSLQSWHARETEA